MPDFTLHRNYTLRTTKGRTITFRKDEPTHVPPICVPDVVAIGAVSCEEGGGDILGEEIKDQPLMTNDERKAAIFAAFTTMRGREQRLDFTASGLPNAKRVSAITEFDVTSKERDEYWQEFRTQLQADFDQTEEDARAAAH